MSSQSWTVWFTCLFLRIISFVTYVWGVLKSYYNKLRQHTPFWVPMYTVLGSKALDDTTAAAHHRDFPSLEKALAFLRSVLGGATIASDYLFVVKSIDPNEAKPSIVFPCRSEEETVDSARRLESITSEDAFTPKCSSLMRISVDKREIDLQNLKLGVYEHPLNLVVFDNFLTRPFVNWSIDGAKADHTLSLLTDDFETITHDKETDYQVAL